RYRRGSIASRRVCCACLMLVAHAQFLGLSLGAAADIAQIVIAATAIAALVFAGQQLSHNRTLARRDRVYQYADRVNELEMLRAMAEYKTYWSTQTFADFQRLAAGRPGTAQHDPQPHRGDRVALQPQASGPKRRCRITRRVDRVSMGSER